MDMAGGEAGGTGEAGLVRTGRVLAATAVAGLALAACGAGTAVAAKPGGTGTCRSGPTITAHGSGQAQAPPDLLTMVLGAHAQAPTAAGALAADNTEAQKLVGQLERRGVAKADVQTSALSISPTYAGGSNPQVTGYQVDDTVTAKVRDLASAGTLIDAAATALGNAARFDGLSFSVQDDSGLQASAHAAAVHAAAARARAMAQAAGTTLGALCSVSDAAGQAPAPVLLPFDTSAGRAAASVPIQPGAQTVSAEVTVVYAAG